jgi:phospholipid-binding lipoprotein MlaA
LGSRSRIRWIGLLFGVAALAVGGCGTMSGSKSISALLADNSAALMRQEPVATAVAAETRVESPPVAPPSAQSLASQPAPPPFVPVTFEAIPPGRPTFALIASSGSSIPAGALLAQAPSGSATPAPPLDPEPQEYDPWESFNEKMFTFNYNFDKYLLKPVAKGYNVVMPDELQRMIGNAFDNINPVPKWANNLLQRKYKGFFTELGRFLINSTLGFGGLWDIAKQEFGLQKTSVDFGQTLGKWGFGPGPFLVLPFLPPLTVRDGIGYGVDGFMDPLGYFIPFIWDRLGMRIGDTVNDRSLNLDLFQGFEESTIDMYSAVRNGYLQRRYNLIHAE